MVWIILLWLTIITIFQVKGQLDTQKQIHELKEKNLKLEWTIKENNLNR